MLPLRAVLARGVNPTLRRFSSSPVAQGGGDHMARDARTFFQQLRSDGVLFGLFLGIGSLLGYSQYSVSSVKSCVCYISSECSGFSV